MENIMGNRIREKRLEYGMTMEQLADKLGVGKSAVNKWEKGFVTNIKRATIMEMAKIFQCSPVWLLGIGDEPLDAPSRKHDLLVKQLLAERQRVPFVIQDSIPTLNVRRPIGNVTFDKPTDTDKITILTREYKELLTLFTLLNKEGRRKLVEYAKDLCSTKKYKISVNTDSKHIKSARITGNEIIIKRGQAYEH